jgi:hypothetical protein
MMNRRGKCANVYLQWNANMVHFRPKLPVPREPVLVVEQPTSHLPSTQRHCSVYSEAIDRQGIEAYT